MARLSLLQSYDALVLLKNSLAMPKLLYILRTTDCSENPLLAQFDNTLRTGLSTVLNVQLNDDQWLQASLSVENSGLGDRCWHLLPFWHWPHQLTFNRPSYHQASEHWKTKPQCLRRPHELLGLEHPKPSGRHNISRRYGSK